MSDLATAILLVMLGSQMEAVPQPDMAVCEQARKEVAGADRTACAPQYAPSPTRSNVLKRALAKAREGELAKIAEVCAYIEMQIKSGTPPGMDDDFERQQRRCNTLFLQKD